MSPEHNQNNEAAQFVENLRAWSLSDLPIINAEINAGKATSRDLIANFYPRYQAVQKFTMSPDKSLARNLLTYLPFGVLSIERHLKESDKNASVFAVMPSLENNLLQLADTAKHPPRDSLYTYCLWNRGEIVSFTGDPRERLFIDVTSNMTDFLSEAKNQLYKATEIFNPDNPRLSTQDVLTASEQIELARKQLLRFLAKDSQDNMGLDPNFFLGNMRQYWSTLCIGGEEWGPPTPANCVPQMELDFIMGALIPGYQAHVEGRYKYMTDEDRHTMRKIVYKPNVLSTVAQVLRMNPVELNNSIDKKVLTGLNAEQLEYLETTNMLFSKASSLTALHWTILTTYLVKPMNKVENKVIYTRGPVNNSQGASGMQFEEVKEIRDMRRLHPAVKNIEDLLK